MREEPRGLSVWGGGCHRQRLMLLSRMRGMTPLLRGQLGDSVTWSKQSMPLAP